MGAFVNKIFRAWYYFRTGYGTYVGFLLNIVSFSVILYYLTLEYFPSLYIFNFFLVTIVGIEVVIFILFAIALGWIHFKKTLAYKSQSDVLVESNPYFYKAVPGRQKDFEIPVMLFILKTILNLQEKHGLIPDNKKTEIIELIQKMNYVIRGGIIGRRK